MASKTTELSTEGNYNTNNGMEQNQLEKRLFHWFCSFSAYANPSYTKGLFEFGVMYYSSSKVAA